MQPEDIVTAIELHDAEAIAAHFKNGLDPNSEFRGEPLIYELISEYARGPRFKECFRVFVNHGLQFDDRALLAVFLDDAVSLEAELRSDPGALDRKYSFKSAFTPMTGASLLHICAEFNHLSCAKTLVNYGMDINTRAGTDENGFGGQTPIFHTVNQSQNRSADMLHYLLDQGAGLEITVAGLIWGKGYEWETLIPSVNPVSYAMMGLLPQMHRDEATISSVVTLLLRHRYSIVYEPENVPCKYLQG